MVLLMKRIKDFHDDNQYAMGELNLFSSANRDEVNQKAVGHLLDLMKSLVDNPQRRYLTLSDLFLLQFRIVENDNDTGWVDKLSHVGSEGTDTLVKAIINIMLINVFKGKVSRKFGDFRIHCMMDEIGKLPETSCSSTPRPPHTTSQTIATPICSARTASRRPW